MAREMILNEEAFDFSAAKLSPRASWFLFKVHGCNSKCPLKRAPSDAIKLLRKYARK